MEPSRESIQEIKRVTESNGERKEFSFHEVMYTDVYNKINQLKVNKACGFDGQPPRLIKFGAPLISMSLLPIINQRLSKSVFPNEMKLAEVSPVFKKNDNMSKTNYRPMSILACQSKLFESVMFDQLLEFLKN